MGKITLFIKKWILCSNEDDDLDDSVYDYRSISSRRSRTPPPKKHSEGKTARFGASADCTLTSRNVETMYDIEEDLTVVAERAAQSAAMTADLLDTLLDMVNPDVGRPSYTYGNKPCLRAELE